MSKSNYVLQALKILGLEEMLKLSQVLQVKQVPLKKAAGEELIVWDESPAPVAKKSHQESEAKVLEFPKKNSQFTPPEELQDPAKLEGETDSSHVLSSELILWQREISRNTGDTVHKLDAFKGYRKSTEMYVVKTPTLDGKDKIRFASTNGVLINKKQA